MRVSEKTGRTVEEAVSVALAELGVRREDVEVEVLDEGSKGLLGLFGGRPARVRVTVREGVADRAVRLLGEIMRCMGLDPQFAVGERDNEVFIDIKGKSLGVVIGRRGETLDALQYLVNLCANKNQGQRKKIWLDVEGYRRRREESLERLAMRLADRARQKGRNIVLEPMSSHERRIIHLALQSRDDVCTFSEGEEPFRKIVIAPKK